MTLIFSLKVKVRIGVVRDSKMFAKFPLQNDEYPSVLKKG